MRYARVAFHSCLVNLRQMVHEPWIYTVVPMWTFMMAVASMYMLRHQPGFDATFVVVGVALVGLWSGITWLGGGAIMNQRGMGTLEILEASPAPLFISIGGMVVANIVVSLVSILVSYAVAAWLFGYSVTLENPALFMLALLLTLFALWAMAMVFAPAAVLWPAAGRIFGAAEYPVYLMCGFLVPLAVLPIWLLPLSFGLPPTWAAIALHGASSGPAHWHQIVGALLVLAITGLVQLLIAVRLFGVVIYTVRRRGTLPSW